LLIASIAVPGVVMSAAVTGPLGGDFPAAPSVDGAGFGFCCGSCLCLFLCFAIV
jgi:hypothetical protein